MLVKFFPRGKGRGTGPVEYITRPNDPITKEPREPLPEVLRGDPEITANLIDSLDFQHKYTSGVLSFAPEDAPTAGQIEGIMDSFEEYAFAGLEPDRYNIRGEWVSRLFSYGVVGASYIFYWSFSSPFSSGKKFN